MLHSDHGHDCGTLHGSKQRKSSFQDVHLQENLRGARIRDRAMGEKCIKLPQRSEFAKGRVDLVPYKLTQSAEHQLIIGWLFVANQSFFPRRCILWFNEFKLVCVGERERETNTQINFIFDSIKCLIEIGFSLPISLCWSKCISNR